MHAANPIARDSPLEAHDHRFARETGEADLESKFVTFDLAILDGLRRSVRRAARERAFQRVAFTSAR